MRYRLLIFDFDGTLADTFPAFVEHLRQTLAHFHFRPIDEKTFEELRGQGAREIIARLEIPAWKVPLLARHMRRLMAADAAQTKLFPGAAELLRHLAGSGRTLAIFSSNAEANVRTIFGPELAGLIHTFSCGSSLFGKAARFRRVLQRTGVPAREALAIGDEIRDLEAARDVGIAFGAVAWGYTRLAALQTLSPAASFHHLDDLRHFLDAFPPA